MRKRTLAVAAVIAAVAATIAALGAAAAGADAVIHACKNNRHGLLRLVAGADACKSNETAVSWAEQGPAGPAGPAGADGPAGPQGPAGVASLAALGGTACTTFDGVAGHIELGVTATDLITLTCETGAAPPPPPPTGAARLVVNEVDYDQVGTDAGGFVEIFNKGDAAATLDGIALVLINGDGTEYNRVALTGSLAAGAYRAVDVDPQNGAPDGIALVDTTAGTLLDALSYEGEIRAATIGTATFDLVEGTPLPVDVADSNTVEGTLARLPNGADTNNAAVDWAFTPTPTKGAANT